MIWLPSNQLKGQQLLLWFAFAFLVICLASGLPDFPDNARIYSRVLYNKPGLEGPQLFTVEEFLNKKDGNIMLKVKESRSKQSKFKNYYRVGVVPNKLIDTETNKSMSSVVEYDPIENQCNLKQLDEWPLSAMSNILKTMTQIDLINQGKELAADWTAIGPMALLRLVMANSKTISSKSDDESEYFFWNDFLIPDDMLLRVVCAVPIALVDTRGKISTEITFDSIDQLHSFRLSFIIYAKNNTQLQYNGPLLLSNLEDLENMHISYLSIQDRSVSKHQGLDAFDDDEANPFTMPSGLGCGFLTNFGMLANLLFLDTTQFSGLYMSENSKAEQFIAFDGHSRHLRVDRIGESKIIYDLRRKRATLIADRHLGDKKQVPRPQEQSEPREKCAQMVLLAQKIDSGLYEVERMADVIGFESYTGLAYLGSKTLEDGVHCLLFERELSSDEIIPLIMKLNMRTEPRPNDKLYLTFYFADEFFETKKMAAHQVERPQFFIDSVWLKRIELKGKSSIMTHSKLLSQVTFSQSAWNLGIAGEFENDRQLRNLHPVATFDTLECKTTDLDQTKLELVIEQIGPKSAEESMRQMEQIYDQSGAVEESIIMFLARCIGIPRSQINKLELILPPAPTQQQQQLSANAQPSNQEKAKYKILAETTIIPHLDFNFEKYFLGWVKTYAQISYALKDDVVMLRYDEFATYNDRFECAMIVATSVSSSFNRNLLMLFCPHVGCGYIRDLGTLEYIKNDENPNEPNNGDNNGAISPTDYYDRCEIHRLKKIADPDVSKKYSPQNLKFELQGVRFSSRNELSIDPIDKSVIDFEGRIAKVVATKGGHHHSQSLGDLIQRGTCYTTKLTRSNSIQQQQQLQVISLSFDVHQSSAIYCHKACLLYPHCRTYSYSTTSRVCVLTNLPKEEANSYLQTHPSELISGPSCNLYALNAMQLYKDSLMLHMISLASLHSSGQYYFAASSQEECASLCHEHEFSNVSEKESRCLGFKYFKVNGMCAIEDKGSHLFDEKQKQIHDSKSSSSLNLPTHPPASKTEYFISLLTNHAEWEQTNSCQNYDRDYSQYYEHTAWTRVNTGQPITEPKKANKSKKVDADADSSDLELIELKTLYDLSPQACLRECSIVLDDCVMVDYCFHPINSSPTRYCVMYRIVEQSASDQLIKTSLPSSTTTTQLNEFLKSLTASGDSNLSQSIFKKNPACDNYRLSEDYLTLKRQIAENSKTDSELNELAKEDSANSENYLNRLDKLIKNHLIGGTSTSGFGFGSAFSMLAMGACLGSLMAYFMVDRPKIRPTIEGPILASNDDDTLDLCDASQERRDHSNVNAAGSSIELNELMDLYEH